MFAGLLNYPFRLAYLFWPKICLLLLLCGQGGHLLVAQVPVSQPGFSVRGELPEDFLRDVEEAYTSQLSTHSDFSNEQAGFFLQNAYQVNQLLRSGKVLFNDAATGYLNLVTDQILKDRPTLRQTLRVYAVRSPEVNAFSTNDGIVLVNLGLLAHVRHEAQIAFILCHEISHYLHQHPLDIYLKKRNSEPEPRSLGDDSPVLSTRYTREKELEADRLGWELFLETGYDPVAALDAFDLVKQAGKPFGEAAFRESWVSIPSVLFPQSYLLDEIIPPSGQEVLERQVTHPGEDERRLIIEEFIRVQQPDPGQYKQIDYVHWEALRTRCQYEVVRMQLMQRRYERALFNTFLLHQKFPDDPELLWFRAYGLYALATYANDGRLWDVHVDHQLVHGHQQQLNYLISMCEPKELTAIALHFAWNLQRIFPDDESLRLMNRDLMEALSVQYIAILDAPESEVSSDQAIFFPAMLEMMEDSAFAEDIGRVMIRHRQFQDLAQTPMIRPDPETQVTPELDLVGLHLGLDRVVWVDPFYQVIRYQEEQPLALKESVAKERMLTEWMERYADQVGLQDSMLSFHRFRRDQAGQFQDLAELQAWVEERSLHEDLPIISPVHNEISRKAAEYGTPYFIWTGCIAQQERRKGKSIVTLAGLLFPPLLPYTVWYLASPRPRTLLYSMVYNLETGNYEVLYPHIIEMKDREDVVKSALYDLVLQLSETP